MTFKKDFSLKSRYQREFRISKLEMKIMTIIDSFQNLNYNLFSSLHFRKGDKKKLFKNRMSKKMHFSFNQSKKEKTIFVYVDNKN